MSDYRDLAVDAIDRNPDQPRKHFDEEALAELAASLRANGLLEPIVVRPHPEAGFDGERWLIIAGERRWRAAALAGLQAVPCRILDVDEVTAFELSVAENVNRHDMTPIEEAQAFATLQGYGRDVDEVSRLFGKSTKYVANRLLLLDLSDECQAQVAAGRIAVSVATMMAQLNPGNQQAMLFRLMRGDFANDNEALHTAYALREGEGEVSMFDLADEPDEEERAKRKTTGRKVKSLLDKIEALSEALGDLAALTPEEYAALGTDARTTVLRLDRMARQVTKARFNARQGAAVAEHRNVMRVSSDAVQTG